MKKVICINRVDALNPVDGSCNIFTVSVVVQGSAPLEFAFLDESKALAFISRLNAADGDKYLSSLFGYIQDNK